MCKANVKDYVKNHIKKISKYLLQCLSKDKLYELTLE